MSESFLHYIWQYQYFNKSALLTTNGESIHVFSPGIKNTDAGPDFQQAKVKIGEMQWMGSVEIHIAASGWKAHHHDSDDAYNNVILHVVWENDIPVKDKDGIEIPTLELRERVDVNLISSYKALIANIGDVACASWLPSVKPVTLFNALDRTLSMRLQHKANEVLAIFNKNRGDWEETTYQLLARNYGFKVNSEPFMLLANALPYKTVMKHRDKLVQVEALLFGVAGFLSEDEEGEYIQLLTREYNLLRRKYMHDPKEMNKAQWKFLRLRPANFPTIRIAQFASYLHYRKNIFSHIMESSLDDLLKELDTPPSSFWQTHYNFTTKSALKDPGLGISSIENILINTIVPLYACYSMVKEDQHYMERALRILYELPSEANSIIRKWDAYSVKSRNAFDSQALLELYNNFCSRHRCLDCNIGASLVKPN